MRLGEIDLSLKPVKASMFLCKPDRTVIAPLKDIYNAKYSLKSGVVNELNFTIPAQVERGMTLVDNPLIQKIKHRYLVKLAYNDQIDYLVFLEENKSYDDSGENISYRLYSEGYLLADKDIRDYSVTSKNLTYMLNDILEETIWKFGYVDADFDALMRSHEISSQTVLQAVYDLAEKFNAVIVWDTINYKIHFYNPSNIGMNRGLKFKEGKYLESFNATSNSEEIVTRMKIYGKDGLTIRKLTPTGVNYLEDFSWFMYPFQRDSNGNVLQSSDYMSDSLCIALENYSKKLEDANGTFDLYLSNLAARQDEKQQREQELSVLEADLETILDEIDVLNESGSSGTPAHADAIARRNAKQTEITNKKTVINNIDNEIAILDADWASTRATLVIEANLTADQLMELNNYVIVKEHTNDTIIDEEDLLEDGIRAFNEFREPKVNLSMSIVNFLSIVEAQNDWKKLYLGDIVTTESKRLNTNIQAKIIEIEYDFESDSISLTIANEKKIQDDYDKWTEQIYNAGQTSTQVNMNKFKWDLIEGTSGVVSQIISEAWDANKRNITAGYQQNIIIGERGIIIKSPQNPLHMLVIQSGMLAISNDGSNTWKHAITADGIIGDRIIGKLLMGTQLIIEDENGIIRMQGSLQEIFDPEGNVKVALGEYEVGKYGIKIDSGALEIVGGINSTHIDPLLYDEFSYDDTQLRNDLRLVAPLPSNLKLDGSGITASHTTNPANFARLDYRGLYVQGGAIDIRTGSLSNQGLIFDGNGIRGYNSSGTKTFEIDTNGRLTASSGTFSGNLSGAGGTFSGNLSAAGGTFTGTLSGVDGTFTGSISANQITSGGTISGVTVDVVNAGLTNTYSGTNPVRFWAGSSFSNRNTAPFTVREDGTVRAYGGFLTMIADVAESMNIGGALSGKDGVLTLGMGAAKWEIISGNSVFSAANRLTIGAPVTKFTGSSVDFSSVSVTGLTVSYASTAGNANALNGLSSGSFSLSGHSHPNSEYVMPYTGQSLKLWRDGTGTKIRVYQGSSYTELSGISG